MPIYDGILQTVISFRFKLKKLLHKRHYEKFADGTVKDIEDEIPFDVPEGWAWCRLRSLVSTISSKDYQISEREIKTSGTYPVISQSANYIEGYCDESNYLLSVEKSIIIFGDHTRNVKYIDFDFVVGADGVKILKPTILINDKFLYYSILYASSRIVNRGYSRHFQFLSSFFFPIPSLTEQKLIVEQIENDYKVIDKIENNKAELQTCVLKAKSKILDLAIHGKLVPQDANDEPASVLLEKLRAEKEDKIAKGELKRDKNDSYIYKGSDNCYYQRFADEHEDDISEEISFEIPNNWIWCRLRDIGDYKKGPFGSALKKSLFVQKSNNTIKVYEQKNAIQKNYKLGNYYITKDYFNSQMQGFEVLPGDIIVSCAGTIGETYVMPENIEKGIINQALMRMRITRFININYFLMYFDHILKEESAKSGKGTAIKNIPPFDVFKNFLIPIPPYEEQLRIVSKITEFSIKLDSIANNIE